MRAPSQKDLLLALVDECAEPFRTTANEPFADVRVDGVRRTWPVRSAAFRTWLRRSLYGVNGSAASPDALEAAIGHAEALALFKGPTFDVFVRVAAVEDRVFLDLGDATGRAVEITPSGWRLVDEPPVRFVRPQGSLALPEPVRGGDVGPLREFLNCERDGQTLCLAWMLAALRGRGPYPVLALLGEQGTAKSSATRLLRGLIDPRKPALRQLPRTEEEAFIAAGSCHVLAFDNVSSLTPAMSDGLCRLATGAGFAKRRLYSDSDETLFDACRPVILNGIGEILTRADLIDRALVVRLQPIADGERQTEAALNARIDAVCAAVLGGLLDALAIGLRETPNLRLDRLPRMADFAQLAHACEPAGLWPAGGFAAAFEGSRAASDAAQLEGEPISEALVALTARGPWTGSMTDLLAALNALVDDRLRASHAWPKAPRALSSRLDRAAPVLRRLGLEVEKTRSASLDRTRLVTIRRIEPSSSSKPSSAAQIDALSEGCAWTNGADDRATLDEPAAPSSQIVQHKPLIQRGLDGLDELDDRRGPFRARFAGEL